MNIEYGMTVEVVGEVVPYAMADKDTGEEIAGMNLRVAGDVVGCVIDGDLSRKIKNGEVWYVKGKAVVSKRKAQVRITEPQEMRRLRGVSNPDGPKVTFDLPAEPSARNTTTPAAKGGAA